MLRAGCPRVPGSGEPPGPVCATPHPIQSQRGPWLAERPGANDFTSPGPGVSLPLALPRPVPGNSVLSHFSHVWLFATLRTPAHQAPLSMGFSRQEHWSGLPCPPPGARPDPGIECASPVSQADSSPTEPPGKPLGKHTPDSSHTHGS